MYGFRAEVALDMVHNAHVMLLIFQSAGLLPALIGYGHIVIFTINRPIDLAAK